MDDLADFACFAFPACGSARPVNRKVKGPAVYILLEGTPQIDIGLLEAKLLAIPGVIAVHDLHLWTITSGNRRDELPSCG